MKNCNRKIVAIFALFIVISFTIFNSSRIKVNATEYHNFDFSNITEQESMSFVESHKIDIPKKIENSLNLGKITQKIIKLSYDDPSYNFVYNYDEMQEYANYIQNLIKQYNGGISLLSTTTYQLKDNTVKNANGEWVTHGGAWNEKWRSYNCYAYSIHRNEEEPFYSTSKQYQPGDMSGSGSFGTSENIGELANVVKNDLLAMGYSNVILSTSIPTISDNQELICVRMGEDDYHFMRYDMNTNAWYHKPGRSAVLKYNYTPYTGNIWQSEYSLDGVEGQSDIIYDSDIYFIKYNKIKISTNSMMNSLNNLSIQSGKDIMLEIDNKTTNKLSFSITSQKSMIANLYDKEMTRINTYTGNSIVYESNLSINIYYLTISFSNQTSYGNVSVHIHTHLYEDHYCTVCNHYTETHDYHDPYTWINYTQHKATCGCGATTQQGHAVSSSGGSLLGIGTRYKTCLLCGGSAEIGFVQLNATSVEVQYVTDNGSYILPNGVIVLVDEDIEAYMNQTLIFQKKNTNLATE